MMRLVGAVLTAAFLATLSPTLAPSAHAAPLVGASPPTPPSSRVFLAGGSQLRVDDRLPDGSLVPTPGSPYSLVNAYGVAVSPRGYVFATNRDLDEVAAFRIDPDGGLSAVPGSPFKTGGGASGVAVSADGSRLFVTDQLEDAVSVFVVAGDGSLTPVAGSPFAAAGGPGALALSPDGTHLYVATDGRLLGYAVAASGPLAPDDPPVGLDDRLSSIAMTPDGTRLYAVGADSGTVYGYAVSAGGSISPLVATPLGGALSALDISPDGENLYVTDLSSRSILSYAIAADGRLTGLGSTGTFTNPRGVAVAPGGAFVYVSAAGQVNGYARGSNGSLTHLPASPFPGVPTRTVDSVAVSPDRAPTAAIAPTAGTNVGLPLQLDGSGSGDPDGTVARYDWDFGDGTAGPDAGPTPRHTFRAPGTYQVTLTLTDDLGCSTAVVYTGRTASCALTTAARTTRTVHVDPAQGPSIVGHASSRTGINPAGWSRTPVTITWSCAAAPATTLVTGCPDTVKLKQLHGKLVSRTITDSRGQTATASVLVRIDGYPPYLTVHGVRNGRTYSGVHRLTCTGHDRFVGRVRCRVRTQKHRHGSSTTVTYRAVARDPAGNTTVRRGRYFVR